MPTPPGTLGARGRYREQGAAGCWRARMSTCPCDCSALGEEGSSGETVPRPRWVWAGKGRGPCQHRRPEPELVAATSHRHPRRLPCPSLRREAGESHGCLLRVASGGWSCAPSSSPGPRPRPSFGGAVSVWGCCHGRNKGWAEAPRAPEAFVRVQCVLPLRLHWPEGGVWPGSASPSRRNR